ncbi:MAG: alpha-2-macroglobulin family protein [Candidatus Hydrogenedentes bacterium]|nr:alpha-2-macroglobulin family protein [Candidatus Hydrogenedentota bacterium]
MFSANRFQTMYREAFFTLSGGLAVLVLLAAGCSPQQTAPGLPQTDPKPVTDPGAPIASESDEASTPPPVEPKDLAIVGTVPLEGDLLKSRITVFFNENIVVDGADKPDAPAPFTMQPEFAGTFMVGPNYIDIHSTKFSATEPVQLTLSEAIKSAQGKPVPEGSRTLNFAPFRFEVRRMWQLEQTAEREVIGVLFPTAVTAEGVQQSTTVKDADGNPVQFTVEPSTQPDIARLVLPTGIKLPVTIVIGTALADTTGGFQLAQEYTSVYPDFSDLRFTEVRWSEREADQHRVALRFSKAIDPGKLDEFLTVKLPSGAPVEYSVYSDGQTDWPEITLTLDDANNTELTLELKAGLEGLEHTTLRENTSKKLAARAVEPQQELRVEDEYWDYGERDGLAFSVGFNLPVNVPSMKDSLTVQPKLENLRIELGYNSRRVKIFGDWDSGREYRLLFAKGMTYGLGGKTNAEIDHPIVADTVPRYVGFGQDGKYYFPRRDGLGLPLETRNASKVKLRLFRMFPSNIAVAVGDMENGKPWRQFLDSWSELLTQQDIDVKKVADRLVSTTLPLDTTIPPGKLGVFCLAAYDKTPEEPIEGEEGYEGESAESYDSDSHENEYPSATKIVLFTNIGLLAHWLDNELAVFAHDLYSLEPKAMAKVTVWSDKNQLLATGNTDASGAAKLGPFETRMGVPRVIVVEAGEDNTFLDLEARNDDTREISPDMPEFDRTAYDAFLYADRDLYRPGEMAYLRWLVRSNYGDALANVPLTYSVIKPNGQELASGPTTLSANGGGGLDLATEKEYPTGKYIVKLMVPGSEKAIGSYAFNLEEFVPNTMKATLAIAESMWLSGQPYTIKLNAQHLFGAAASERTAEARIVLKPAVYRPEKWKGYTFGNDVTQNPEVISTGEVQTNATGDASFPFEYTAPATITYPLSALVIGRVFELGGRAVADTKEVTLLPSPISLGLSVGTGDSGTGIVVNVAAITPEESPANLATVKVTLEKQVWNYYVRRFYNYHESNWSESFEPTETREVTLANGAGSVSFNISGYGYYRVRVHSDKTPQFSTQSFYSYGGQPQLVDAARPSLIKLTADKPRYTVGEQAIIRVEAPFDGKGFVVVQGQEIQSIMPVEIVNGVGSVSLPIGKDQYPNVWVEATVVHAIKDGQSQVYPFSSFALASLEVDDPARTIAVTFPALPEEIPPMSDAQFTVETRDPAGNPLPVEVTLAAVDEGIHGITSYESPDPIAYLSRARRPDYRRAHYYDKVAYDFEKTQIGGDLDALMAKRAASVDENWIRPVALWSGVVQTDANGRATVTMKVPEYSGQLRLVAVAASAQATGAQTGNVYVRRPFTLRTSMPRFLLPGDKASCRATVHNNTDATAVCAVSWTVEGTLEPMSGTKEVDVPAHGEASVLVDFGAAQTIGQGAIQWYAVLKDASGTEVEKLAQHAPVPVRAPAAFQSHHELTVLKPSDSTTVKNAVFVDDARTEIEIVLGASPVLRVFDALKHVIGYPYGCIEQTTSRLMPMYLLKQNSDLVEQQLEKEQNLEAFIQTGIKRLFSMQTDSGGLGFWPGAQTPYDYGSVYALHFLTLVKNGRDFELPEENFAQLQNYAKKVSRDWSNSNESALYLRAYAVYVLALGGDGEALQQIQRFDTVSIPRAARFLLAAALAINGNDADRVKLYLSSAPSTPFTITEPDGTLNSEIRNVAVELLALQQINGDAAQMSEKADQLTAFLTKQRHGTTQETAFICAALIGYLNAIAIDAGKAGASIDAPQGKSELKGIEMYKGFHAGPNGAFTILNTGAAPLYLNATTRGVPATPDTSAIAEGIEVTRATHAENGDVYAQTTFTQAESYIIGVQLVCDRPVKNLIVADLIPAGFEIQNPRLEADAVPSAALKGAVTPSYLEVRDDRLVAAFDSLDAGKHMFYYLVRAVTPGHYTYPAVTAECMYDASVRGRGVPSEIDVTAK